MTRLNGFPHHKSYKSYKGKVAFTEIFGVISLGLVNITLERDLQIFIDTIQTLPSRERIENPSYIYLLSSTISNCLDSSLYHHNLRKKEKKVFIIIKVRTPFTLIYLNEIQLNLVFFFFFFFFDKQLNLVRILISIIINFIIFSVIHFSFKLNILRIS
jgi:hypothetical protein